MSVKQTHSFLTRLYVFESLILLILVGWCLHRIDQVQSEVANEQLLEASNSVNGHLIDLLSSTEKSLQYYAKDILRHDPNNLQKLYKESAVFHEKELITPILTRNTIAWIDHNDYYAIDSISTVIPQPRVNLGFRDYVKVAKKHPATLGFGKETQGFISNKLIFPFAISVENDNGEYIGSLIGSFDTQKFKDAINILLNPDNHISYAIISKDDKILMRPDTLFIPQPELDLVHTCFDEEKLSCEINEVNPFPQNLFNKEKVVISKIGHFPLYLVMTIKYHILSDSIFTSIKRAIFDLSLFFISTLLLALYVRQFLVRPVMHLSSVAKQISTGANKIHLENFKSTELDELGNALRGVIEKQHELSRVNEALEFMIKKVSSANQAKTDFIRNMQHEFRTPLNHILGSASVIKSMDKNFALAEYVEMIERSGKDLLEHINRIIDFSDLESGKIILHESQVTITDLITEGLSELSAKLSINNFKIDTKIESGLPDIFVDRAQLIKVLTNLLDNCIKFKSEKKPHITIKAWLENDDVYLQLTDNGIGIKSEELEVITQTFSTGGNVLTRLYRGIGLGLSIVQSILNMHDCALLIESDEKSGTKVVIRIPKSRFA